MNKEFKRMMELAGLTEIKVEKPGEKEKITLNRNQKFFLTHTSLKDPNYGETYIISSPFTVEKVANAIKPLIYKTDMFDNTEELEEEVKDFKNWLQTNMSKYGIFKYKELNVRKVLDRVYGDYLFEVNELDY